MPIVYLSGTTVEFEYPKPLPRYGQKTLTIDDLRVFYTCVNHAKDDDGNPLSDEVLKGIFGVKLGKTCIIIPDAIHNLRNPDDTWAKVIAKVVEKDEWIQELLLRITQLRLQWLDSQNPLDPLLLNRLGKPALPKLVIIYGHEQIQFSDAEIQEIYAGMCWYECERKKLGTDELRTLFGLLAGVEGMETFTKLPPFVIKFIQGDNDPFTDEVRRAATFNKESLLRKVDAVWQNHLHPTLPRGDEAAGTMWSQASISTPDPAVAGYLPHEQQAPEPQIPLGFKNVGSAYGPPDIRPVGGNPIADYGQDAFLGYSPGSSSSQLQHAGMYGQQTTVDKAGTMYSNRDISISTSSGRSASPNRAVAKRQEDEKAHRKTTKGDSEKKKTSGGGGKRSGDSRQKKANEAKDQGKQSRRPRPK